VPKSENKVKVNDTVFTKSEIKQKIEDIQNQNKKPEEKPKQEIKPKSAEQKSNEEKLKFKADEDLKEINKKLSKTPSQQPLSTDKIQTKKARSINATKKSEKNVTSDSSQNKTVNGTIKEENKNSNENRWTGHLIGDNASEPKNQTLTKSNVTVKATAEEIKENEQIEQHLKIVEDQVKKENDLKPS